MKCSPKVVPSLLTSSPQLCVLVQEACSLQWTTAHAILNSLVPMLALDGGVELLHSRPIPEWQVCFCWLSASPDWPCWGRQWLCTDRGGNRQVSVGRLARTGSEQIYSCHFRESSWHTLGIRYGLVGFYRKNSMQFIKNR